MVKNLPANAGDLGSNPGSGRSPGEGNGNPLQYSCLENPMDRGAWWAAVHGVSKSRIRLSDFTFIFTFFQNHTILEANIGNEHFAIHLSYVYNLSLQDKGFPGGPVGKGSACNAVVAAGSIPGLGRSLEEGMAIHSNIIAWRILWTEEPGGLQSIGSQRVRHY